ncbi:hypothetical protein CEE45_05015 [Candidatus Heimdallarchaeota archaeon B3_Heim]|nr:MAG: hypothetical protein CEE45_05015 [Candidatus Heimdallarchaeota archaeon B3_Heim]
MKIDNWIERGLNSLSSGDFFDGMQLMEGAIRRVFRSDHPDTALRIFKSTSEILIAEGLEDLYCQFIIGTIPLFKKKLGNIEWFALLPEILVILRENKVLLCIPKFINKMILETKIAQEDFIQTMIFDVAKGKYSKNIVADLHYYHAGLFVSKQDYVKCFDILKEWNDLIVSSPRVLTYLTLAELNAYEIEGCGKYLELAKSLSDTSPYIELANHLYKSVEAGNYDLYSSIIGEYADIVNAKHDALLKGLCDGISDFLKPKGNKGLFSLFGG